MKNPVAGKGDCISDHEKPFADDCVSGELARRLDCTSIGIQFVAGFSILVC
jgi:hypothetical protein